MATKTFDTRIKMKYDTYGNWTDNNPTPLQGEVCVVVVPASAGAVTQEPSILFKVGDGISPFRNLAFTSAFAADVYSWAKAANKPSYSANEISGLETYINQTVVDTNTEYKIEVDKSNNRQFALYSKEIDGDWTKRNTITIPDETVYTLVEGTTNGTVNFNGTDVNVHGLGSAAYTDSSAYDAAGAAAAVLGTSSDAATANTVYGAKKAAAAAKSTADKKVASVSNFDTSIAIGGTATAPTVKVAVSSAEGNILKLDTDGLKVVPKAQAEYSIVKDSTAAAGYLATYRLKKGESDAGVPINIPKDYLVKSATIATVTKADSPYSGAVVGHKYIDFTVNTPENDDDGSHIYLPVNDLVDVYTAGNGITVDTDNQISLKLSSTTSTTNGLSVDSNGLALAAATTSNAGAMTAEQATKLEGIDTGAEVNQNAFSNVKIGNTTIAADSKTDTLELVAGANVTLTPDATNDKITITTANDNTTYTISKSGNTVTLTGSDGSSTSFTDKDTTYRTGTTTYSGTTKLYTSTGTATDGTMTQDAIKSALDLKTTDAELHAVAKSGEISDLAQDNGSYVIFNCGSSSTLV